MQDIEEYRLVTTPSDSASESESESPTHTTNSSISESPSYNRQRTDRLKDKDIWEHHQTAMVELWSEEGLTRDAIALKLAVQRHAFRSHALDRLHVDLAFKELSLKEDLNIHEDVPVGFPPEGTTGVWRLSSPVLWALYAGAGLWTEPHFKPEARIIMRMSDKHAFVTIDFGHCQLTVPLVAVPKSASTLGDGYIGDCRGGNSFIQFMCLGKGYMKVIIKVTDIIGYVVGCKPYLWPIDTVELAATFEGVV